MDVESSVEAITGPTITNNKFKKRGGSVPFLVGMKKKKEAATAAQISAAVSVQECNATVKELVENSDVESDDEG
jgi:hypothetical protein